VDLLEKVNNSLKKMKQIKRERQRGEKVRGRTGRINDEEMKIEEGDMEISLFNMKPKALRTLRSKGSVSKKAAPLNIYEEFL